MTNSLVPHTLTELLSYPNFRAEARGCAAIQTVRGRQVREGASPWDQPHRALKLP